MKKVDSFLSDIDVVNQNKNITVGLDVSLAATASHRSSHRCPQSYTDKSSKSIEVDAAVEMCLKLTRQYKYKMYVDKFVSDDDATTRKK